MESSFPAVAAGPPPPPPPPPWPSDAVAPRRRLRRIWGATGMVPLLAVAVVAGILLGERVAAEDGRSAAAAALAAHDPARAVGLDEQVAGRSGFLMLFEPGAAARAEHDAQVARIAWARQLAAAGQADPAIAVLGVVREPSLLGAASVARAQILVDAAAAAVRAGHARLALFRLDQAVQGSPPASMVAAIGAARAAAEVAAAAELAAAGHAPDALALLDDASAHGAAATAAAAYPATLLAAGQAEAAALDFDEAAATLGRLVTGYGGTEEAARARVLLRKPQSVSGTLVDSAGRGVAGRVRLGTHFTQLAGGYVTSGPFYFATSDANGDFAIASVPVGGPYVLEYFRGAGWMTLLDPRTDQPSNPVTVRPLVPADLTFIVLPG